MTDLDLAVSLARAELSPPTVGVTAQFFEVHEVVVDEAGQPSVAHVDTERERGAYYVYFPVQEVSYYFVVIVARDAHRQLAVSGRYVEAKVRVYLRILSPTLSPADITAHLGLEPTSTHALGSPITSGCRTESTSKTSGSLSRRRMFQARWSRNWLPYWPASSLPLNGCRQWDLLVV